MQMELFIREVLSRDISDEQKCNKLLTIMSWDRAKVMENLAAFSGHSVDGRSAFIAKMWGKSPSSRPRKS